MDAFHVRTLLVFGLGLIRVLRRRRLRLFVRVRLRHLVQILRLSQERRGTNGNVRVASARNPVPDVDGLPDAVLKIGSEKYLEDCQRSRPLIRPQSNARIRCCSFFRRWQSIRLLIPIDGDSPGRFVDAEL